jgi:hypothetical protein
MGGFRAGDEDVDVFVAFLRGGVAGKGRCGGKHPQQAWDARVGYGGGRSGRE